MDTYSVLYSWLIMKALSEQLKQAIRRSGYTMYRIAQETHIDKSQLSRFMAGKRTLSMQSVDRIGEFLGLTLTATKKGK